MFGLHNSHTGAEAPRYMPETGGTWNGAGSEAELGVERLGGFAEGTRVATLTGWRPVETVAVGDTVLTFDSGPQKVVAVTRGYLSVPDEVDPELVWPIAVPAGALGNSAAMTLLPEQDVIIESDAAEALTGDPFALVPANALVGLRGIERVPPGPPKEVITLHFDSDEVVYADGGALILAEAAIPGEPTLELLSETRRPAPYSVFSGAKARALVAAVAREDARARPVAPAAA